jgi:sugar phosphate isomerase/epimerase
MRLFVPSWQIPGTWLENLEALAAEAWIQGIELLFFSWDEEARLAFEAEAEGIASYRNRFAFSLHLPDPLEPEAAELVAATSSFVERYVFHPWSEAADEDAAGCPGGDGTARLRRFRNWRATLEELFAACGRDRFSLEYTGAGFFAESSALFPGVAACADTGRLVLDGVDPADWISGRIASIREVHLHGARSVQGAAKDHLPLTGEEPWLERLFGLVGESDCVVDLETFSLEATKASRKALKKWFP